MTGLAAAVRLDVLTVRPYAKQLLIMVAVVVWISVVSTPPSAVIAAAAVFAALVAAYPFAIGDKNDLGTLQAVLPVARSTFVRARYLAIAGSCAVALVVGTGLAVVASAARGLPVAPGELGLVAAVGYLLHAVLVGLQLPVYYALGYTRGRMVAYAPLAALSAGVAGGATLLGDRAPHLDAWLASRPGSLVPVLVLVATGVLVGSCAASRRLDARRARG